MKQLNTYINEKLHLNKDIKVYVDAFEIFKTITNLSDDKANDAVKKWIDDNNIKTFDEVFTNEHDVDAMNLSDDAIKLIHIMSRNTYNEKCSELDKTEEQSKTLYINDKKYIKIFAWKNGLEYSNPKLMRQTFIFYFNRNK